MGLLDSLFGHGKDLTSWQMICRAIVTFFITLVLLRLAGMRAFGKKSAFDQVIMIMLGSILSRVVVGASPFIPTTLACLGFALIHSVLGWLSCFNDAIGHWVKGEKLLLYSQGRELVRNMQRAKISHKDLLESVRTQLHQNSLEQVEEIYLERTGELSVIKK